MSAQPDNRKRKASFMDTIQQVEAAESQPPEPTAEERTALVHLARTHVDAYLNQAMDYAVKFGLELVCDAISEMVEYRCNTTDVDVIEPTTSPAVVVASAVHPKPAATQSVTEEEGAFANLMSPAPPKKSLTPRPANSRARQGPISTTPDSGKSTVTLRAGYSKKA